MEGWGIVHRRRYMAQLWASYIPPPCSRCLKLIYDLCSLVISPYRVLNTPRRHQHTNITNATSTMTTTTPTKLRSPGGAAELGWFRRCTISVTRAGALPWISRGCAFPARFSRTQPQIKQLAKRFPLRNDFSSSIVVVARPPTVATTAQVTSVGENDVPIVGYRRGFYSRAQFCGR